MAAAMQGSAVTLADICGAQAGDFAQLGIRDLVSDSRDVRPGAAFCALAGQRTHGLEHAAEALARGAVVVLFDPADAPGDPPRNSLAIEGLRGQLGEFARRFHARAAARPTVSGITGTNGKTTVAWLLASSLCKVGRTAGYIGTLGYGLVPQLAEHRLTTPDCLTLHRQIAQMPVTDVALEVSSIGLEQGRLDGIDVRCAVFTNLSHDHLDAHGSIEVYAAAKAQLFARPELEHAVLNIDSPAAATMRSRLAPQVRVVTVSLRAEAGADLTGFIERHDMSGMRVRIEGTYGSATIGTPLIGRFNAENLLLTLGALLSLDVPLLDACEALSACSAPPGRMEVVSVPGGPSVVVDYAHTPDALAQALGNLRELCTGELWCVFGCGGDRDSSKRPAMGAAAGRAEHVVVTDDNPRSEDPGQIVAAIMTGLGEHRSAIVEHDRGAAIEYAISNARAGDVVLVAGRGHERLQQRRGGAVEFDDRRFVQRVTEGGA